MDAFKNISIEENAKENAKETCTFPDNKKVLCCGRF